MKQTSRESDGTLWTEAASTLTAIKREREKRARERDIVPGFIKKRERNMISR